MHDAIDRERPAAEIARGRAFWNEAVITNEMHRVSGHVLIKKGNRSFSVDWAVVQNGDAFFAFDDKRFYLVLRERHFLREEPRDRGRAHATKELPAVFSSHARDYIKRPQHAKIVVIPTK